MAMIVCSDLHINKELLRLTECLNFLDYIADYGEKNNIKKIAILGDLFHTSNNIKNQMFIPFFNKLYELKEKGFELYIIPGNHDAQNNDNDCLAEAFKSFAHFIKKSETINIDGTDYDFLAYTQNPSDIPNNGQVLLTHLEVEGFYFNPKQKCEDATFTKGSFDQYELVVSGHLHRKQENGNIVFCGSPYSTRRDESGNHYFAVVDGTNYELIEYNDAPEYLDITIEEALTDKTIDYNNKIVEVEIGSKVESWVKLRDLIIKKGAVEVTAKFVKQETAQDMGSHKIDTNEGVTVSMTKYLTEVKKPGINNNELLEAFKNVLKRVNS